MAQRKVQKKSLESKHEGFLRMIELLQDYPIVIPVGFDNMPTSEIQLVRKQLRGIGVMFLGKNTVVRKAIRTHMYLNPNWEALLPLIRGNVGFVFTKDNLLDVYKVLNTCKVPAAAKVGMIAQSDVWLPAGPTGLEPTKTSFLQALSIPSKINRGQVEMLSDFHLIKEGEKVGPSESTLLTMLNIMPFYYAFTLSNVYDDGQIYEANLLDINEDEILTNFHSGVSNVACLSLATGLPTVASFPHSILNGFKNLLAVALETDYLFDEAVDVKNRVENPDLFVVETVEEVEEVVEKTPTPEEVEESDDGMGFNFFDESSSY